MSTMTCVCPSPHPGECPWVRVACPSCKAAPGESCMKLGGSSYGKRGAAPHASRVAAARQVERTKCFLRDLPPDQADTTSDPVKREKEKADDHR